MFYASNLEVDVGKQLPDHFEINTSASAVVTRLCELIFGSNRSVTTDGWFTSKELADTLLNEHKLLGTIGKNKKQLPPEFVEGRGRPVGSNMFGFQGNCTLLSYIPRKSKNVLLLSTMHDDDYIDKPIGKPEMICDYNQTKGGVKTVDKLCSSYNCARPTKSGPWWYSTFFQTLLQSMHSL
ncbi:hypothetical protein ILUMI_27112 [Ignelater luminosus]|uniref:PiggyBac transposable element-derived protein domain-containing protein n=1 Tax=Ignelater luminosus TaxID=2038154 RepID=A0A8K0FYH3_IGNLU|nr:hypothetical protein ILUMI_27112 [Ignelater luminosus]